MPKVISEHARVSWQSRPTAKGPTVARGTTRSPVRSPSTAPPYRAPRRPVAVL